MICTHCARNPASTSISISQSKGTLPFSQFHPTQGLGFFFFWFGDFMNLVNSLGVWIGINFLFFWLIYLVNFMLSIWLIYCFFFFFWVSELLFGDMMVNTIQKCDGSKFCLKVWMSLKVSCKWFGLELWCMVLDHFKLVR